MLNRKVRPASFSCVYDFKLISFCVYCIHYRNERSSARASVLPALLTLQ